jgi:hypothetical protein
VGKKKPATVVIELFSGVRPLARLLRLSPGAISKWQEIGRIPGRHHETLLDLAREHGKRLTAEMLIIGA